MKSIKVTVLGKQFPLKVNDDDEEMMYRIADYVDTRFHDFKKQLTNQQDLTILVLASLSIAEELFLEKNKNEANSGSEDEIMSKVNSSLKTILDEIERENSDIE